MKPYQISNPAIFSNRAILPCASHTGTPPVSGTPQVILGASALAVPSPCPEFHAAGTLLSFRSLYWSVPCWQSKEILITPNSPSLYFGFLYEYLLPTDIRYTVDPPSPHISHLQIWRAATRDLRESLVSREGPGTHYLQMYIFIHLCV